LNARFFCNLRLIPAPPDGQIAGDQKNADPLDAAIVRYFVINLVDFEG
jgi:hypothetical protein